MPAMNRFAVFVVGPDRPGIIAAVSQVLFEQGCNLEDVNQTSLLAQFVGIFIATAPTGSREDGLLGVLTQRLVPLGLSVLLRPVAVPLAAMATPSEPYVITTIGPDRAGLVAGITALLAQYGANITNLKAVTRTDRDHQEYVMFYEVDVPADIDRQAFRADLLARARDLGLEANLQHREIFEQIHRI
jgi:glycine cleavage system transcriptional repressor